MWDILGHFEELVGLVAILGGLAYKFAGPAVIKRLPLPTSTKRRWLNWWSNRWIDARKDEAARDRYLNGKP